MNSSREKRITLRFYMDDPIAGETYHQLLRRRAESSESQNTLIVETLHRGLCQPPVLLGDPAALEELLRRVICSEGKALLREYAIVGSQNSAPQRSSIESRGEDKATDDDDEDDDESLDLASAFCSIMA